MELVGRSTIFLYFAIEMNVKNVLQDLITYSEQNFKGLPLLIEPKMIKE